MNEKFIDITTLARIETVAREKGVTRTAVYMRMATDALDVIIIDGIRFIVKNEKYNNWTPKKRGDKK